MDLGKACEVASLDEFKRLLTHATLEDLRKTYVEESTLFHIAARRPDGVGFLEELISAWRKIPGASIDLNVKNRLGNTPLHDAAFHGHESVTTYLLERGASASIVNRENKTPMDVARDRRNGRCLGAFGGNPGDVTVRLRPVNSQPGRQGILASEALAISCRVDSLENFIRALKSSAPAGLKWKGDESGDTLLHLAARRPEGVLFLQAIISARGQESFNVNAQNRLGRTPLHEASLSGHEDIVRLLLQKGALDSVPDLQGQTPIDVAKEPLKAYFIEYKRSIASPSKSAAVVFEESVAGPSAAPLAIPPLPIEPPRAPPSRATRSLFGGNRAIPPTTERRVIADFQAALIDRVRATPSGAHVGASAQAGERIAAKLEQRGASKK
jgi:ankyrin repeat protein